MNKIRDKIPVHSYKGEKWKTNASNKRRLVEDFMHRCAYCNDHDHYSGGYNTYHVDHFAPKSRFKELEFVYENLMYSCPYCNAAKKDKWVSNYSNITFIHNKGFINPCTREYDEHLQRDDSGKILFLTPLGEYMYKELKLYLIRHSMIYKLDKIRLQIKLLKKEIDIKKEKGDDTKILEDIYKDMCVTFSEYYDVFLEAE